MLTCKGWFDSNFRRDEELVVLQLVYGRRRLTVGHLNLDQANNRQQHSLRSRGIRCVSTSKVGSTPSFVPKSPCICSWIASTIGQCTRFLPGEVRVQVPGGPRIVFRGVAKWYRTCLGRRGSEVRILSPRRVAWAPETPCR